MQTRPDGRRLIGVVGPPGAGKSTLAAQLAAAHPDSHIVVPMDGFHLAQRQLLRLGRSARKGAPDTFDVDGFVALLARVRREHDGVVYAPFFDRSIEEPIANAIAIEPRHTTVITEGNYLLHTAGGWEQVRPLLDECWYVECDESVRVERLIARHVEHGRTRSEAVAWVAAVDQPNARLILATRQLADRVVRIEQA